MSTLSATVLKPVANIRRAPNTSGGIIKEAKGGQVYEVVGLIDGPNREQWARIILPDQLDVTAYICVHLAGGTAMCSVSATAAPVGDNDRYNAGYIDGYRAALKLGIETLVEKLEQVK
jgi:hypothetical protein